MPTASHAHPRLARLLGAAILLAGAAGCASRGKPGSSLPDVPLVVRNSAYADVIIYANLAASDARVRVGTVTGNSDARFNVRRSLLRGDGYLVLSLRAIGSRYGWTTPSLSVQPGDAACLDVLSDASGDLSRSSFYSVAIDDPAYVATDSAGHPLPRRTAQRVSCRAGG